MAIGHVDGPGLAAAMRAELERNPDLRMVAPRYAELVLRGTLVEHRQRVVRGEIEVHCVVSVIVADARGGSIRAMLRGRADARGGSDAARLSDNALRAAVRGALRRLATASAMLAGDVPPSRHER